MAEITTKKKSGSICAIDSQILVEPPRFMQKDLEIHGINHVQLVVVRTGLQCGMFVLAISAISAPTG